MEEIDMSNNLSAAGSAQTRDGEIYPADQGYHAWLFLAACVTIEVIVWGFSFTYGIFQSAYETGPFKGEGGIAAIGTTASGIVYLTAPIAFGAFLSFPRSRRWWPALGAAFMTTALAASSFATNVPTMVITQGLIYGIGCSLVYTPTICYLDEWFNRRKGLAFGMMCAGTGIGGVILPFSMNAALSAFSFRTVLRAYSVALAILLVPLLTLLKPRLPPERKAVLHFSLMKSPYFIYFELGNVLQSLGFFLPTVYLPTYASSLGASNTLATLSLVLFNVASVIGCVAMGALVDRLQVTTCIAISSIGSTLSVFLLWGMAYNLGLLYTFAVLFGIFAGSFSSTWSGIMRTSLQRRPNISSTMVFAFLAAGRGLGNIISGPVSTFLIAGSDLQPSTGLGYDTKFKAMIIFTGISAFLGGIAVTQRIFLRVRS